MINFHALRFAFKDMNMDFSLVTSTFDTLRITPPSKLSLLDAQEFTPRHYPPTPPDVDTLIIGIDSRELGLQVKKILLGVYPEEHGIFIVDQGKKKEESLISLEGVDFSGSSCIYVPSLGEGTSFESF